MIGKTNDELMSRYNLVIHFQTAASGARDFYTLENNNIRIESPEKAIVLDEKVADCWQDHNQYHMIKNEHSGMEGKLLRAEEIILESLSLANVPVSPPPRHQQTNQTTATTLE